MILSICSSSGKESNAMDPTKTREINWEPPRSEHQGAGRVVCTPRTAPHSFKLHVARHIQERYIHRQDDKTTVADFDQTPKTTRKGSSHDNNNNNNNDDKEKDRNNLSFPLSLFVCVSLGSLHSASVSTPWHPLHQTWTLIPTARNRWTFTQ